MTIAFTFGYINNKIYKLPSSENIATLIKLYQNELLATLWRFHSTVRHGIFPQATKAFQGRCEISKALFVAVIVISVNIWCNSPPKNAYFAHYNMLPLCLYMIFIYIYVIREENKLKFRHIPQIWIVTFIFLSMTTKLLFGNKGKNYITCYRRRKSDVYDSRKDCTQEWQYGILR